jgi:hypothetical protein
MASLPTTQIGDEVREMTDTEHELWLLDVAVAKSEAKAEKDKAKLKTAVLDRLGLTADEVAALLA